jgi:hypothetical protein
VPVNIKKITAAFSNTMDSVTLTSASFTLSCPLRRLPVALSASGGRQCHNIIIPVANLPASTNAVTVTTGVRCKRCRAGG